MQDLLIWTFSVAHPAVRRWGWKRLVLVLFQTNQKNEPLAEPATKTDNSWLAFTESTLEALYIRKCGTHKYEAALCESGYVYILCLSFDQEKKLHDNLKKYFLFTDIIEDVTDLKGKRLF